MYMKIPCHFHFATYNCDSMSHNEFSSSDQFHHHVVNFLEIAEDGWFSTRTPLKYGENIDVITLNASDVACVASLHSQIKLL